MTFPTITFPDAVALVIGHLSDDPDITVPVHKRIPNPRPASFVTVQRVGGVADLVTDDAQVMIGCWGDDDVTAADLAIVVRGSLGTMRGEVVDGAQVYRVTELAGPADIPDPDSDQYRMRWTITVQVRGATPVSS